MTYKQALKSIDEQEAECERMDITYSPDYFAVIREALEKQIPKKPVGVDFDMVGCASCRMVVVKRTDKWCPNCGQALDWSDDNG